jgi:hypothetical protein
MGDGPIVIDLMAGCASMMFDAAPLIGIVHRIGPARTRPGDKSAAPWFASRGTLVHLSLSIGKLGCVLRTPHATTTANASEVETHKAEAFTSTEV